MVNWPGCRSCPTCSSWLDNFRERQWLQWEVTTVEKFDRRPHDIKKWYGHMQSSPCVSSLLPCIKKVFKCSLCLELICKDHVSLLRGTTLSQSLTSAVLRLHPLSCQSQQKWRSVDEQNLKTAPIKCTKTELIYSHFSASGLSTTWIYLWIATFEFHRAASHIFFFIINGRGSKEYLCLLQSRLLTRGQTRTGAVL